MLLPPETLLLNRYSIIHHLGYSGRMMLYNAKDQVTNDTIILKHKLIIDTSQRQSFTHQVGKKTHFIRFSAQDRFTNEQGEFTIIRDRLGDDLETLLRQQKRPFAVEQIVEWANQLLCTLEYLHSRTIPTIHGYIRPSMLKLSPQNEIILLHHPTPNSPNEIRRDSMGKFNSYASPEQLNGLNTNHSSDLYSLGATLSYLLIGKEPPTTLVRMYALTHQHPDPLGFFHQLDFEIPQKISNILMASLHISPIQRPSSARAMRKALNKVTPKLKPDLMQKPQIDSSPFLLYQQSHSRTKRAWLQPLNFLLAPFLFLILAGLININSPFTVHGDTFPAGSIRLTIPTPIVDPTYPIPAPIVDPTYPIPAPIVDPTYPILAPIVEPTPLREMKANRPLDTNRVYLKQ